MRSFTLPSNNSSFAQTKGTGQEHRADIVIVGNGIAGMTAALEARRLAPDKRIVIVTAQCHPTINTPSLKQFVLGKLEREQLLTYPLGTERAKGIQVIYGRVEEIRAQRKEIALADGGTLAYGSLLIATGSTAQGLSTHLPGQDFDGVLILHRLQDYVDLRRRLHEVNAAVVIGGGAHAIETVTCLMQLGIQTHWLIRGKTCLPRVLDGDASNFLLRRMEQAGVSILTETEAIGFAGHMGVVAGVMTNQQRIIPCQLVLVCTGTRPVTTLAEHCSSPMLYERNRGILVNNQLHTNVPDIYAAGDVAAVNNPQTGTHEIRAQWYAAVVQGCAAAKAMTGQMLSDASSFGVPWHATRLGELSLLTVGNPTGRVEGGITLTDSSRGIYRRLSMVDDRLVGYLSLGSAQADGLAIKRLIDEGHSVRPVKEALLKGKFDARQFFLEQHSSSVFALTTSGKIPVVSVTPPELPLVRPFAAAGEILLPPSSPRMQFRRPLPHVRKDRSVLA